MIELLLQGDDFSKNFKKVTLRAIKWFLYYFFAFMALMLVMASLKNLVGTFRPFFFDVCKPDLAANCTTGTYISSDFQCTNLDHSDYLLFEVRRSFPSGHVVCSVFSCGVLMWYLQKRISKLPLLLAFMHIVCIVWIMICSVTRITDNWHHLIDVIGGLVLTLPFVFYVVSKKYLP